MDTQIHKQPSSVSELAKYESPQDPTVHDFTFLLVAKPDSNNSAVRSNGTHLSHFVQLLEQLNLADSLAKLLLYLHRG